MAKNVKGATITFDECEKEFAKIPLTELEETEDFIEGFHWGGKKNIDGKYWIGWKPVPDLTTGKISEAAIRQWQFVQKSFKSKNVIGSNISRLEGAILGNEPDFDIVSAKASKQSPVNSTEAIAATPKPKTADEIFYEDIDDMIVNWWTQKGIHQICKDFLSAKAGYGKASVLVSIPSGFLEPIVSKDKDGKEITVFGLPGEQTFASVLDKITVELLHYSNFIDVKDKEFGRYFTIVKLDDTDDSLKRFGVFYVDVDNLSYYRVVVQNKSESEISPDNKISCNLSGNNLCITVGQYNKALVTAGVKSLQRSVNHAKTGEDYALANINFPQTYFINATEFEEQDANGNATGKKVKPLQGPGVVGFLKGLLTEKTDGVELATPSVHESKAADPEKFTRIAESNSRDIDELMGMSYKNASASEYTSGKSKERSMDDWDVLKLDAETSVNNVGTQIIENAIRLAFNFTKQTQKNKEFNVLFHVNISSGEVTNEDKTTMQAEVGLGLRSDENYMLNAKVSDNPKVEIQRIRSQPPKEVPGQTDNKPAKKPEK